MTRRRNLITARYPELARLADLPAGTVLDGELIVLDDGLPSFPLILKREQARGERTIARLAAGVPAAYVVFDLLYQGFEPVMDEPLATRRERLTELAVGRSGLVLSEGVVGEGSAAYGEACERGLEGVVAKRLASPYLPGRRTDAWVKIKWVIRAHCAVIGYLAKDGEDIQSLLVAAADLPGLEGEGLRYVGRVGSGITDEVRGRLLELMTASPRSAPLVPCSEDGRWVEPGLYCTVSFNEITAAGVMRAPVFEGLIAE